MEQIKESTELKRDKIEYHLKKFLGKKELYKIVFTMSNRRFERLMDDIRKED